MNLLDFFLWRTHNMKKYLTRGSISIALGLASLLLAILGGMHVEHSLQHGGHHLGEAIVLIALSLGTLAASARTCVKREDTEK